MAKKIEYEYRMGVHDGEFTTWYTSGHIGIRISFYLIYAGLK